MQNNLHLAIEESTFTTETGEAIKYKRFVVRGSVMGEITTLKLKLDDDQLFKAKMLINTTEKLETAAHAAMGEEKEEFDQSIARVPGYAKLDDNTSIDLDSED